MIEQQYTFPIKAIKKILAKELKEFKDGFFKAYPNFIMSDMQKEFIYIAYQVISDKLNACETYEQLNDYISYAGYRMSLKEWIDSL